MTADVESKKKQMILPGVISGVVQAGLFTPWDRALYLSVMFHRPFLRRENFFHPYAGFSQTVIGRTVSAGLYFTLYDTISHFSLQYEQSLSPRPFSSSSASSQQACAVQPPSVFVGLAAGSMNGLITNQISVIKYYKWGTNHNFSKSVDHMFKQGGYRVFFKGSMTTASRDMLFGSVYEFVRQCFYRSRHRGVASPSSSSPASATSISTNSRPYTEQQQFGINLLSAVVACTLSSPLNYVRNIQYAHPASSPPDSALSILQDLWVSSEASNQIKARAARHFHHAPSPYCRYHAVRSEVAAIEVLRVARQQELIRQAEELAFRRIAGDTCDGNNQEGERLRNRREEATRVKQAREALEVERRQALFERWDNAKMRAVYLQQRLRLGWGTLRVGIGMAVGHYVYLRAQEIIDKEL